MIPVVLVLPWKGRGELSMSEFEILTARPQTRISRLPFHKWTLSGRGNWAEFYRIEAGYLIRFPDLADFEISAEDLKITCFPAPHVGEASLEHLYSNQILPLVLSKKGELVFHASAVEVEDGAVAFSAESGRGKSTLAAHFVTNGYRFLTDDGLILRQCDQGFQVIPSRPSIRLWEDSGRRLESLNIPAAPPLPFTTKARFVAGPGLGYCHQPRLLRTVYFLGDGNAQDITFRRSSAAETFVEWVKNSFLLDVEDQSLVAGHFDRIGALANTLVCYHLDYPRRYDDLSRLLEAILDHINSERLAA